MAVATMSWALCEVRGGIADLTTSDDVWQVSIDWDNVADDWIYTQSCLRTLDEMANQLPADDLRRIRDAIRQLWPLDYQQYSPTTGAHR